MNKPKKLLWMRFKWFMWNWMIDARLFGMYVFSESAYAWAECSDEELYALDDREKQIRSLED